MEFKDKVVVITGGSQGFGKTLAKALANKGARIVISSSDAEKLKATASELKIDSLKSDVTSRDELRDLADYVLNKFGKIDVWINNAGIQIAPSKVEDVAITELHKLFEVNFFGYFYGCQVIVPIMKKQGHGVIVNINSTAGLEGKPEISAYSASKFAVKGLTQSLRAELKDTGIKVYGIHPGGMQTEIYKEKYPNDFNQYMSVEYAVNKVLENFSKSDPELDLIVPRP
jgi:NAD(P)-dependent dehydrogenase (short-subunit alcohol dehydrogenase family)